MQARRMGTSSSASSLSLSNAAASLAHRSPSSSAFRPSSFAFGLIGPASLGRRGKWVHPRARGTAGGRRQLPSVHQGPSPRARDSPERIWSVPSTPRSIPASAGRPGRLVSVSRLGWTLPVCGTAVAQSVVRWCSAGLGVQRGWIPVFGCGPRARPRCSRSASSAPTSLLSSRAARTLTARSPDRSVSGSPPFGCRSDPARRPGRPPGRRFSHPPFLSAGRPPSFARRWRLQERHPETTFGTVQVARPGGSRSSMAPRRSSTSRAPPSTLRCGNRPHPRGRVRLQGGACVPSPPASSKGRGYLVRDRMEFTGARRCYTVPLFIHARVRIRRVANLVGAEAVLKLRVLRSQPRLRCVLGLPRRGSTSGTTPSDTLME